MTSQPPEKFINLHPRFNPPAEFLYRIVEGHPYYGYREIDYPIPPDLPHNRVVCSANWRGFVATLTLHSDGSLVLNRYNLFIDTILGDGVIQEVNKEIPGCFWLEFSDDYTDNPPFVRFAHGKLVEDCDKWRTRYRR